MQNKQIFMRAKFSIPCVYTRTLITFHFPEYRFGTSAQFFCLFLLSRLLKNGIGLICTTVRKDEVMVYYFQYYPDTVSLFEIDIK